MEYFFLVFKLTKTCVFVSLMKRFTKLNINHNLLKTKRQKTLTLRLIKTQCFLLDIYEGILIYFDRISLMFEIHYPE